MSLLDDLLLGFDDALEWPVDDWGRPAVDQLDPAWGSGGCDEPGLEGASA